ncbi:hypothetical protein [Kriegella aquimaris]|nr:hypothetical protein [Kriegella aquimaris]
MSLILNFKNIALESIGLLFLGFGVEKLKVASQSEEYLALFSLNMEKFKSLTSETIGSFTMQSSLWRFGALAVGLILIGLFKLWKKDKKGIWDSLIAFLLVFSLIHLGFFGATFTNSIINFIGDIFTENFMVQFIINGLLWSAIGIGIIFFALKKHYTQQNL